MLGVIVWINMRNKILNLALSWKSFDCMYKVWFMNNLDNYFVLIIMGNQVCRSHQTFNFI
jgi:hypothetical protein